MNYRMVRLSLWEINVSAHLKHSSDLHFSDERMLGWDSWYIIPSDSAMWTADGFLHKGEVLDFAGGNVVHVAAGFSGLVCSIVVGKRHNFGRQHFHPHNILISVLGAALLWVRVCLRMSVSLVLPRVSRLLLT